VYNSICCEKLNLCSKLTIINGKIINKNNNILNHNLQLIQEEYMYVCSFCLNLIKKAQFLHFVFQIIPLKILLLSLSKDLQH
jgi:hypothetical protein